MSVPSPSGGQKAVNVMAKDPDPEGILEMRHKEILTRLDELFLRQETLLQNRSQDTPNVTCTETERFHVSLPSRHIGVYREDVAADSYEVAKEMTYQPPKHGSRRSGRDRASENMKNRRQPTSQGSLHVLQTSWVQNTVRSWHFEAFFALVIVTNTIFLGVQTAWMADHYISGVPIPYVVIQVLFAVLFSVELFLRVLADGIVSYVCTPHWPWNLLDVFVVLSSIFELAMLAASGGEPNPTSTTALRVLRIMKVARLVRIVRVGKVLRFIRALRILIYSIMQTLKSLLWSLVLLFVIIYAFGVLFTDVSITYQHVNGENVELSRHFGSLWNSMNTLLRSISGGMNWAGPADALAQVGTEWAGLFTLYVTFAVFAVLNVMTGVFCHSAITGAAQDEHLMVQSLLQEKDKFRQKFEYLFQEVDDDGTGRITLNEFERHFKDASLAALFEALDLGSSDAWSLFQTLDADGDHMIDLDEFLDSCIRMRGPPRSVDVCAIKRQATKIRRQVAEMSDTLEDLMQYQEETQFAFQQAMRQQQARELMPTLSMEQV